MADFKCACGKEYKSMKTLYQHGINSKKGINDGNGCPIYQQRKINGLPLNVAGLDKETIVINDYSSHSTNNIEKNGLLNNGNECSNNVNIDYKDKYEKLLVDNEKLTNSVKTIEKKLDTQLTNNMTLIGIKDGFEDEIRRLEKIIISLGGKID